MVVGRALRNSYVLNVEIMSTCRRWFLRYLCGFGRWIDPVLWTVLQGEGYRRTQEGTWQCQWRKNMPTKRTFSAIILVPLLQARTGLFFFYFPFLLFLFVHKSCQCKLNGDKALMYRRVRGLCVTDFKTRGLRTLNVPSISCNGYWILWIKTCTLKSDNK